MKRFHGWNHVQTLDIEVYQLIKEGNTYQVEDLVKNSDDTWERMSSRLENGKNDIKWLSVIFIP